MCQISGHRGRCWRPAPAVPYDDVVPSSSGHAVPATDSGEQLAEVVAAIALAADLGMGQPMEHMLRSCVIADRFAGRIGMSREDRDATYWVTLFTTAGCTGTSFELSKVFGDDIGFRASAFSMGPSNFDYLKFFVTHAGSDRDPLRRTLETVKGLLTGMTSLEQAFLAHCAVSAKLAERLGLGDLVVGSLLQTFARWDGKGCPRAWVASTSWCRSAWGTWPASRSTATAAGAWRLPASWRSSSPGGHWIPRSPANGTPRRRGCSTASRNSPPGSR